MSDYSPNSRFQQEAESHWGPRRRHPPPPVSISPHESELEEQTQAQVDQSLQSGSPLSQDVSADSFDGPSMGPQSFYPPMYVQGYQHIPYGMMPPIPVVFQPASGHHPTLYPPFFALPPGHHLPYHPMPDVETDAPKVENQPKPSKRVIAIKDPKTGQALDLSDVSAKSQRAASSTPKPADRVPLEESLASPERVTAPAEEPRDRPETVSVSPPPAPRLYKELKGIKNKPLDILYFAKPQTPAYMRMLARRIYNKPLNGPSTPSTATPLSDIYVPLPSSTPPRAPRAPKAEPQVPKSAPAPAPAPTIRQLTFPLSREVLLSLLPRERPTVPSALAQLCVVRGGASANASGGRSGKGDGKRGSQQPGGSQWRTGSQNRGKGRQHSRGGSHHVSGGGGGGAAAFASLKMSEGGYRVLSAEEMSEQEQLRRQVQSLLNKITPDSFAGITEKIASIPVSNVQSMDTIVSLVFDKAVAEHAYCEMYANMCRTLKDRWPELEMKDEESDVMVRVTFVRCLIDKCQVEFDAIPQTLDPSEAEQLASRTADELESIRSKKKERILGNMKFIAQLYLRNLLSTKVVKSVVDQLMATVHQEDSDSAEEVDDSAGVFPEEHYVECVCLVLNNIGMFLEQRPKGGEFMDAFFARLKDLHQSGHYSKRIVYLILNLMDARRAGWRGAAISSAKLQTVVKKEEARRIPPVPVAPSRPDYGHSRFSSHAPPVIVTASIQRTTSGLGQTRTPSGGIRSQQAPQSRRSPGGGASSRVQPAAAAAAAAASSSSDTDSSEDVLGGLPVLEERIPTVSASVDLLETQIKRFRDYFAEEKDISEFVQGVADISSAEVARVLFQLGSGAEARKVETDAVLIAQIVKVGKISIADVESCYVHLLSNISDTIIDVPTILQFHSHLLIELVKLDPFCVAERLLVPHFCDALKSAKAVAHRLLGNLVGPEDRETERRLFDALLAKKTESVAAMLGALTAETSEEETGPKKDAASNSPTMTETTLVDEAMKGNVDSKEQMLTLEALAIVHKYGHANRLWTLARIEKLFGSKRQAWGKHTWNPILAGIKTLFVALLEGSVETAGSEVAKRSGSDRMAILATAMMKAAFKTTDVEGVFEVCLDWQVVTLADVEKFVKQDTDADDQGERKHTEEGLMRILTKQTAPSSSSSQTTKQPTHSGRPKSSNK